ncbi:CRISPR-associated protein, Cmr4 family [Marinitoga hydrogenitolerans DSM 16785]|uniref:CRISPR-associated protein, Cmr4 family n=1 Tax=Marinitoga hydrogenitolerans (strain DSM 16785 / JCM 12826 / AT1271) TaxID=1122195 RepID=A0A1M5AG65_MARH1|nr:type III-B CRISPR module RAMP protein Cmr4 [Marinitoga hydrogenitolerans]SHF29116.1 CRISPR-associated protein, Cmr4 family [Marinitoga hydrogenitolerans DSM 16785]
MSIYKKEYILKSINPIHIGTGGVRLGRVDNTIIRKVHSEIPYIPGTALSGALRGYSAIKVEKASCGGANIDKENYKSLYCGHDDCPICQNFGYTLYGKSKQGNLKINDAEIILFPVKTNYGIMYITTIEMFYKVIDKENSKDDIFSEKMRNILIDNIYIKDIKVLKEDINIKISDIALEQIIILDEKMFSYFINKMLEVRTSVSLENHIAIDGALFTYEAIPENTYFYLEINSKMPFDKKYSKFEISDVINRGFEGIKEFGIGGMTTRGFGSLELVSEV